ncbi:MAG: cell division protein FtsL [Pseudomonadota bacterium]
MKGFRISSAVWATQSRIGINRNRPTFRWLSFRDWAMKAFWAAIFISALATVYVSHMNRAHISKLSELERVAAEADQRWIQLNRQQNELMAFHRVEEQAATHFQMQMPDSQAMVMVQPEFGPQVVAQH